MQLTPILKKILLGREFEGENFKFRFLDVEPKEDFYEAYNFYCNVTLPKPNQSYCLDKFSKTIESKIEQAEGLIGKKISYSIEVSVNNMPTQSVYINGEDLKKIKEVIDDEMEIISEIDDYKYVVNLTFSKYRAAYEFEGDAIIFNLDLEITGKNLNRRLNDELYGEFANYLTDVIHESNFSSRLENEIFMILNSSMGLSDTDVYVQVNYFVRKIAGQSFKSANRHDLHSEKDFLI